MKNLLLALPLILVCSCLQKTTVEEYEGFINYGSPIEVTPDNSAEDYDIIITESRIEMPVFKRPHIRHKSQKPARLND